MPVKVILVDESWLSHLNTNLGTASDQIGFFEVHADPDEAARRAEELATEANPIQLFTLTKVCEVPPRKAVWRSVANGLGNGHIDHS